MNADSSLNKKLPRTLFIVGGILVVVVAVIIFLLMQYGPSSPSPESEETTPPLFSEDMSQDDKRQELFVLIDQVETKPLTKNEKLQILREFGGERTAGYQFSQEEIAKLLEALKK